MEAIEQYLERLAQGLGTSEESKHVVQRTRERLYFLAKDYIIRGYTEDESVAQAIALIESTPEHSKGCKRDMLPLPKWVIVLTFIGFNLLLALVFYHFLGLASFLLPSMDVIPIPWFLLLMLLISWSCMLTSVAYYWRKHHAYIALISSVIIAYASYFLDLNIIALINVIVSLFLYWNYRTWKPAAIALLFQATQELTVRLFFWVNLEIHELIPVPDLSLGYVVQYSFRVWIVPILILLCIQAIYKRYGR